MILLHGMILRVKIGVVLSSIKDIWDQEGLVVVDDVMPEEILYQIRGYGHCTEPDDNVSYKGGYKQIYWEGESGFPIKELSELNVNLYDIFSPILDTLQFNRAWYFIHNNECPGVTPHADQASVNINMWLTPDYSVKNKNKNGLCVWDVKPPEDWSFHDFNKDEPKISNYLRDSGAKKRNIEYKCNRAIMFQSSFFHETNGVSMRRGYWNRRLNLTYLYT